MKTIRQLTFVKKETLEWREVNAPIVKNGKQATVKPVAVARCDLDRFIFNGHHRIPGPFAFGHEIAGIVDDVGDEVSQVQPGDRVIVPFQINCGECRYCQRGWTNACQRVPFAAAYGLGTGGDKDYGGGFSDLINVPFADAMLIKIPNHITDAEACGLSDNVAEGYRLVAQHLKRFPGESVLIIGGLSRSIGLYAVMAAFSLGAVSVHYMDTDDKLCTEAKKLGATVHHVENFNDPSILQQFLIVIDTNCTPSGLAFALHATAPCGYCSSVSGGLSKTTELPLRDTYMKGITYDVGRVHGRAILPELLNHLEHSKHPGFNPLAITTRIYHFHEVLDVILDPSPKIIFTNED